MHQPQGPPVALTPRQVPYLRRRTGLRSGFRRPLSRDKDPAFPQPDLFHSTSVKSSVALFTGFVPLSTCDRQAFGATLLVMSPVATERATSIELATAVEKLRERIAALGVRRQQLRRSGATRASLEQNRRQLARSQAELGHTLIE